MTLQEAIKILKDYQLWRRGKIDEYPYTSTQVGIALDVVIEAAEQLEKV